MPDVPLPVPLVAELPPPLPGMPGPVPPLSTPVDEFEEGHGGHRTMELKGESDG